MRSKLESLVVGQKGSYTPSTFSFPSSVCVNQVAVQQTIENQMADARKQILNWLSSLSYVAKQNDNFERAVSGTGKWLLDDPKFQAWIAGETRILWCPGDRIFPLFPSA